MYPHGTNALYIKEPSHDGSFLLFNIGFISRVNF